MGKTLFLLRFLGISLLAAGMAACGTTGALSGSMANMQGQPIGEALAAWGEPEATEPFGEQTVMIWRDYAPAASVPIVICERWLAVDESGKVTGWRWRGDACESLDPADRASGAYALAR